MKSCRDQTLFGTHLFECTLLPNWYEHQHKHWKSLAYLKRWFNPFIDCLEGFCEGTIKALFNNTKLLLRSLFFELLNCPNSYSNWWIHTFFRWFVWPLSNVPKLYPIDLLGDKRLHIDDDCNRHSTTYLHGWALQIIYQQLFLDDFWICFSRVCVFFGLFSPWAVITWCFVVQVPYHFSK